MVYPISPFSCSPGVGAHPVLQAPWEPTARAARPGGTAPSCRLGSWHWEDKGCTIVSAAQHPPGAVLSPAAASPAPEEPSSRSPTIPCPPVFGWLGTSSNIPALPCTVVFFWQRASRCGDEIKSLEQEHALPCRDWLLPVRQGWAPVQQTHSLREGKQRGTGEVEGNGAAPHLGAETQRSWELRAGSAFPSSGSRVQPSPGALEWSGTATSPLRATPATAAAAQRHIMARTNPARVTRAT